ncbi:MAG: MBL fold metallo-hydrolase, partial [Nevskiales bacterium]
MRFLFKALLVLAVIGLLAYYPLVLHSPVPGDEPYVLDIDKVRALATSRPGPLPIAIHTEKVAEFEFAEAMVMAGEPWQATAIPIYSYQLVFPGSSIIVDTAVSSTEGVPGFMVRGFDEAAYQRMSQAMKKASHIVITHEHFDHIAGIFDHPELELIMPAVLLTTEQMAYPDRMKPAEIPQDMFVHYKPLEYEGMHALAPGVVLIKAPGHTPGSQMVYVRLAN